MWGYRDGHGIAVPGRGDREYTRISGPFRLQWSRSSLPRRASPRLLISIVLMKIFHILRKEYLNALRVGWFLAFRQIRRTAKSTTVLIVFIMVLTFLNLVVVSGLLIGLITGSLRQYRESYSGAVIVTAASGKNYIENSKELVAFFRSHPEVKAISPRYGTTARLLGTLDRLPEKNKRPNQLSMRLTGIDPIQEERLTRFSRFVKYGSMISPDDEGQMLIGANLIKKYSAFADANIPGLDLLDGVDVGSRVRVTIPTTDGTVISKEFVLKGIVKSKVDEISTRMFITDRELKRLLPATGEEYQENAGDGDLP